MTQKCTRTLKSWYVNPATGAQKSSRPLGNVQMHGPQGADSLPWSSAWGARVLRVRL